MTTALPASIMACRSAIATGKDPYAAAFALFAGSLDDWVARRLGVGVLSAGTVAGRRTR